MRDLTLNQKSGTTLDELRPVAPHRALHTAENNLIDYVREIVSRWLARENPAHHSLLKVENPVAGKMLRTSLVKRLYESAPERYQMTTLAYACAAVELVHVATLFHDDVIDTAETRRGEASLWRRTSPSASILFGDLYLCGAIELLSTATEPGLVNAFIQKMRETCVAEIKQEIMYRGSTLDQEKCLLIARGKTGPLFAFSAGLLGQSDARLRSALEEAGYLLGTAYQLADDLIDETGDTLASKKTLGTDRLRRKYTLAQDNGPMPLKNMIEAQCRQAQDNLGPWPVLQAGLKTFLEQDFYPALHSQCSLLNPANTAAC